MNLGVPQRYKHEEANKSGNYVKHVRKRQRFIRTPKTDSIRKLASKFSTTSRPRYFTRAKIRDLIHKKLEFDNDNDDHDDDNETSTETDSSDSDYENEYEEKQHYSKNEHSGITYSLSQPESYTRYFLSGAAQKKEHDDNIIRRMQRLSLTQDDGISDKPRRVLQEQPRARANRNINRNKKHEKHGKHEKYNNNKNNKNSAGIGRGGIEPKGKIRGRVKVRGRGKGKGKGRGRGNKGKGKKIDSNDVRIVHSRRMFDKKHVFGELLVEPSDDGSGSYLYLSKWDNQDTVTKLLPLYSIDSFTEDESYENALRESEYHIKLYRVGCKLYGKQYCPIASIVACVEIEKSSIHLDRKEFAKEQAKQEKFKEKEKAKEKDQKQKQGIKRKENENARNRNRNENNRKIQRPSDTSSSDSSDCSYYNSENDNNSESENENGNQNRFLAIVMPKYFCSLADFVRDNGALNVNETFLFLDYSIRFLNILHNNVQLIHNDIKPENVFVEIDNSRVSGIMNNNTNNNNGNNIRMNKFVFADFGCSVGIDEEFPFGGLTGTLTLWDLESLGNKHGKENGFSIENDLYGVLGCIFDGIIGRSIIEEMMDEYEDDWNSLSWKDFSDLVRICRRKIDSKLLTKEFNNVIYKRWNKCQNKDLFESNKEKLITLLVMDLGKPRQQRLNLQQIEQLFHQVTQI